MSETALEACERRGRLAARLALEACFLDRLNEAAQRRLLRLVDRAAPFRPFSEMIPTPSSQRNADYRHA